MKFSYLKSLVALVVISFLASCGGDDDKADDKTESKAEYFIEFKMDGVEKSFKMKEPGYQACGSCACAWIPPFASSSADITVCIDNEFDEFPASEIEALTGSTIVFSEEDFPNASFSFTTGGVDYSTYHAENQTGSTFDITEVSEDGEFGIAGGTTFQMFKVKGTFSCTVREEGGDTDIAITEGKFVVRFSEN